MVNNYDELNAHFMHSISIVRYDNQNVAIECFTCHEVLLDFDRDFE